MHSGRGADTETPFTWSSSGRSVLKLNIRHLWLFGVWPLGSARLYQLYVVFVFALGVWNFVEGSLAVSFSWRDLEATTLVLTNTFTMCSGIVKLGLFTRDRGRYGALARRLDALVAAQGEPRDPALRAVVRGARGRAARLSLGLLLFMASQGLVWFPMPLLAHPGERRLPFAQHHWDDNAHYYELSYAVQCVTGLWMAEVSFGLDCLFATAMMLAAAQLQALALRLARLRLDGGGGTAAARDEAYRELCRCIQSHQQILRFIRHLNGAMSPIAMTQFVFSVLVACVALFQATYSTDITAVIKCVSFLPIPGGQVYLYCWAAHHVTEQAEAVSAAAYCSPWADAGPRFQRALRILIGRAQKPPVLTAGHLYPINRQTFLSACWTQARKLLKADRSKSVGISNIRELVNASYTYYALLGQMNKRSTN